jgi:hypothetical protein
MVLGLGLNSKLRKLNQLTAIEKNILQESFREEYYNKIVLINLTPKRQTQ